ncbi:OmpA family protein [Cognatishimia sp. WU-CL00825]|uniref:OmpA family protein n=1 Tax=Cognatishimia sp. WU-CL00825 TaxID=3127658 RepID=UPI0031060321
MTKAKLFSLFLLCPLPAAALELAFPEGSVLSVDKVTEAGAYSIPDGPYFDGFLSTRKISGFVSRQVWQLEGDALTTAQLIDPLRNQIQTAGFEVLLDCEAATCGGFDFRFEIEVLPAPDMFVDLIDYRFMSALRETDAGPEAISVLVSRTETQGLTQLIAVQPGPELESLALGKPRLGAQLSPVAQPDPALPGEVIKALDLGGHVILSDLAFQTGSAQLSDGPFASLQSIADFLQQNPEYRIALVGHTDTVGALDNNMALSKQRAAAVRSHLIEALGVAEQQLDAQGVGYLAPIATNQSAEGREANRRVEAILLTP